MQPHLTLVELNRKIKDTLNDHLSPTYWVVAEISDLKGSPKGHAYLELVEKTGAYISAKLRANIWSYSYRTIAGKFQAVTGQPLQNGMKILAMVSIQFHEIYGLSLNIQEIDPSFTVGERARKKQEVIDRLTKDGLMDMNKQYALPTVPQHVAIISSSTAAGFGDFIDQIKNNKSHYAIHWQLFPAVMQGNEAVPSIIQALEDIANASPPFQLVAIIRGGGAQLDMDCYDDYELAKAIAHLRIPVITGIGHERDECVADLVAHTKIKTPTAVAEFILSGFRDFEDKLNLHLKRIERAVGYHLQKEQKSLRDKEHLLISLFKSKVTQADDQLGNYKRRINSEAINFIKLHRSAMENLSGRVKRQSKTLVKNEVIKINTLEKDIQRLNPQFFFNRGYTRSEIDGKPIHLRPAQIGDNMITYSLNQKIKSNIASIEDHER
jgi:exodeoxyribonuclease VII large subunit